MLCRTCHVEIPADGQLRCRSCRSGWTRWLAVIGLLSALCGAPVVGAGHLLWGIALAGLGSVTWFQARRNLKRDERALDAPPVAPARVIAGGRTRKALAAATRKSMSLPASTEASPAEAPEHEREVEPGR